MLGYTNVERFSGGAAEWTGSGRYLEVTDRSWIADLVAAGALVVDTSGQFPDALQVPTAEIVADPAGALGNPAADTRIVLMGAAAATGDHHRAARALEEAGYYLTYLYADGFAGWAAGE